MGDIPRHRKCEEPEEIFLLCRGRPWARSLGSSAGKGGRKDDPPSQTSLSPPSEHLLSSNPPGISPSPISPRQSRSPSCIPFSWQLPTLVLAFPPPLPAVNLGMDGAIVLGERGPRRRRGRCERGHRGAFVPVPAAVNAALVHSCSPRAGTAAPFGRLQGACPGGHIALFVWRQRLYLPSRDEGVGAGTTGPEEATSSGGLRCTRPGPHPWGQQGWGKAPEDPFCSAASPDLVSSRLQLWGDRRDIFRRIT